MPLENGSPVEVVMVDALPLARYALAGMLAQTADLQWRAGSSHLDEALNRCRGRGGQNPLVLVLDSALDPTATRIGQVCRAHPDWTVVALLRTRHRTGSFLGAALGAGAHGVCARSASPAVLLSGLRQAQQHRRYLDPTVSALAETAPPVTTGSLSAREFQVLGWVSCGASSSEIAAQLQVSIETVRSHIKSVFSKLGVRDRAHAVARAYQFGILAAPTLATRHTLEVDGTTVSIVGSYGERNGFVLHSLAEPVVFDCALCEQSHDSPVIATSTNVFACPACYAAQL